MNLVTRSIIEKDRCLCCDKFDHTIKICLDKNKKNFTYLKQRVHVINLKKFHDHDVVNDIFDEAKYSKNNSLSISSSLRAKN